MVTISIIPHRIAVIVQLLRMFVEWRWLNVCLGVVGSVEAPPEDYSLVLGCASAVLGVVLLTLCVICHRKRRRRRRSGGASGGGGGRPFQLPAPGGASASSSIHRRPPSVLQHQHDLGERYASVDSVWWLPPRATPAASNTQRIQGRTRFDSNNVTRVFYYRSSSPPARLILTNTNDTINCYARRRSSRRR